MRDIFISAKIKEFIIFAYQIMPDPASLGLAVGYGGRACAYFGNAPRLIIPPHLREGAVGGLE